MVPQPKKEHLITEEGRMDKWTEMTGICYTVLASRYYWVPHKKRKALLHCLILISTNLCISRRKSDNSHGIGTS